MSGKKKAKKRANAKKAEAVPAKRPVARQQPVTSRAEEQGARGYGRKALLVIVVLLIAWVIQSVIGAGR